MAGDTDFFVKSFLLGGVGGDRYNLRIHRIVRSGCAALETSGFFLSAITVFISMVNRGGQDNEHAAWPRHECGVFRKAIADLIRGTQK